MLVVCFFFLCFFLSFFFFIIIVIIISLFSYFSTRFYSLFFQFKLPELDMKPEMLKNASSEASMWHKVLETFKYAYADRLEMGDPAFVNVTEVSFV